MSKPPERDSDYYCTLCKTKLFNSKDIVRHDPKEKHSGLSSFQGQGRSTYTPVLNGVENADCCSMFFITKQKWIDDAGGNSGLILCPKKNCEIKLGTYCYSGMKCRCGQQVSPGFLIYHERLDKK